MKKILFCLLLLTMVHYSKAQKSTFTQSKIEKAVVYFGSAELTHTAEVSLNKGKNVIVIENVSDYLNENSIQVYLPKGVSLLSTQFSRLQISEPSPLTKQIKDSILIFEKQIKDVGNQKIIQNKLIELLDENQKAITNNVAELSKFADFHADKRLKALTTIDVLTEKEQLLNLTLSRLKSRLDNPSYEKSNSSKGKIILQIMSEMVQKVNFRFNYLTQSASWRPSYELNIKDISSPIDLIYKAEIHQNTGIDWKNVKLTFSSGSPNRNNQLPNLSPWYLDFYDDFLLEESVVNTTSKRALKSYTNQMAKEEVSTISEYTQMNENQMNTSFEVAIAYDIKSNGEKYSVALKQMQLPAQYQYYSIPKISKDVFLVAQISDYSQYNLLSGEATIIFENMYVGKTQINANLTENVLKLSLGRDQKISVNREKISDKSGVRFLSSYKEQVFTYDISIRNNKKYPIEVNLTDQYPLSSDESITINLLQSTRAEIDQEKGTLNWKVRLQPNETQKYRISYRVKYPKDKNINL